MGGLEVSAPGLGCMGTSHGYGSFDDVDESVATLHLDLDDRDLATQDGLADLVTGTRY